MNSRLRQIIKKSVGINLGCFGNPPPIIRLVLSQFEIFFFLGLYFTLLLHREISAGDFMTSQHKCDRCSMSNKIQICAVFLNSFGIYYLCTVTVRTMRICQKILLQGTVDGNHHK